MFGKWTTSHAICLRHRRKKTHFTIIWGGGLSSTPTSLQHPLGWCDGCHRTTAPVRSPHTRYRWRGERVIEPIKCMRSPHTRYRWRGEGVIEPIKCMRSPHTRYRWRGERVIEPIKCMRSPHTRYRWRGERVIEPIKCMCSPHTSYRWRGERVIEPIKCMRSPHTRYRWRGERVIEPIKCMRSPHTRYRWRGERVIEPIKCMCSPHTSYRWRGERVIEPITWMGIIRRPWLTRASGGTWPGHRGYTSTLYRISAMGFLMTTGPRFNISSERQCYHLMLIMLFGASVCTVAIVNWSCPYSCQFV